MKITIIQGGFRFTPEDEADHSALEALDTASVARVTEARRQRSKLRDLLLTFEAGSPWRLIADDPPPEGERVLLLRVFPELPNYNPDQIGGATYVPRISWGPYGPGDREATHWRPTPEPLPEINGATPKADI